MLRRSMALALPALLLAAASDTESGIFINPVQVFLSARSGSGAITLRNQNPEPVRFQLTVFGWGQGEGGKPLLTPTQDILFSPPLLILRPKEERKIRLVPETSAGSVEKTYRLLIEELQPPRKDELEQQVSMLTAFSLPIFLPPFKPVVQARIESLIMWHRHWTFQVRNAGNIHIQVPEFSIQGLGPSGNIVVQRKAPGGYVLAGNSGLFPIEFTHAECLSIRKLKVDLKPPLGGPGQIFDSPPSSCE